MAIVDGGSRDEVFERLERVGRSHPSRTIVCAVADERATLGAEATMACEPPGGPGATVLCREHVALEIGRAHLPNLDSIVDPLVITDVSTMVWSPHGHEQGVDALAHLAQVVLLDSEDRPTLDEALARAGELSERLHVVDLSWLRSAPWRERIAGSFDPPDLRGALAEIDSVVVRHHPRSTASALLLAGWLGCRLGWSMEALARSEGVLSGSAQSAAGGPSIDVRLEAFGDQDVPGLAGVTLGTASGLELSLDRGPGGLAASRRTPDGHESSWVILGASRGERGILGEGIRQGLLRDPFYRPALAGARAMLP